MIRWRSWPGAAVVTLAALVPAAAPARAQESSFGGSLRAFQFVRVDATEGERRDTELVILRLTGDVAAGARWRLTAHGVFTFLSPPVAGRTALADAPSSTFLPLSGTLVDGQHASLAAGFDRLQLEGRFRGTRLIIGRQAVTWGTNYFWPALDLFAPFTPAQIDRDYKPGVDAVRLTVPLGALSEVEVVGAVLGPSSRRDGAVGALARIHLGGVDVGPMAGRFHGDTVAGGFVAADIAGTGVRAEMTRTATGDDDDVRRGRGRFWRASVGVDRLITPVLTFTAEAAWHGYGTDDAFEYVRVALADRVRRGEVTALGRRHAGVSLRWEVHPLWIFTNTALINARDGSTLWVPTMRWSTSDNTEVLFGAQVSFGPGRDPRGLPRSEYGPAPAAVIASVKAYF